VQKAFGRRADLLLVTDPVSINMEEALERTLDAVPDPKLVVAVGHCGTCGGVFGYGGGHPLRGSNGCQISEAYCESDPRGLS